MNKEFKVYDAMTKEPICVHADTPLVECAQKMSENNVGSVLVKDERAVQGIITEFDVVRKAVASGKDVRDMKASNIMATTVTTIEPDVDLFEAISLMVELDIRHLPVMHDGEFVGLLTAKDILKIEPALFDIMIQNIDVREQENKPIYLDTVEELDYGHEDDAD